MTFDNAFANLHRNAPDYLAYNPSAPFRVKHEIDEKARKKWTKKRTNANDDGKVLKGFSFNGNQLT